MKPWSQEAWAAAQPVYEAILAHPFVAALADGTLPREHFMYYLRQDSLYLGEYTRVLAHAASRMPDASMRADFLSFASDGIAVERALHSVYLGGSRPHPSEMSPACMLYTSVLLARALDPVEVEAAALLPCFWVYQRVGEAILARQTAAGCNPYKAWIDTYADEAFELSTRRAIEICDRLAATASPRVREKMSEIFVCCAKMEWMFWDSAMNLEKWKI
ncbi:MAG: thiaminase II [Muribaculaceae bacterium]|nr:thiaminase II [Muribaculaceae bacterium]